MDPSGADTDILNKVLGELASLRAENAAVREENLRLAARMEALDGGGGEIVGDESTRRRTSVLPRRGHGREPTASDDGDDPGHVSRRGMLKVAGATALGAAGAAVARAAPAAANDGDAITVGNQVDLSPGSTARTVLYAGTGGAFGRTSVFNVVDQAFTAFPDNGDAVIYGGGGSKVLNGVAGTSTDPDGFGVRGQATGEFSVGVVGTSTGSQGDGGLFTGITGVAASGSRYDLRLHQGRLGVVSGYAALPSDASRGDQVTMNDGTLWYCVTGVPGTTPGIWRRMAAPGTAGALTVLPSPVRVYDSRKTGGPLRNGQERTVSLDNGLVGNTPTPAVPAGAIASLFTLTIVNTGSSGFLAAFSNDVSYPGTSNIDWFLTNSILATSVTSAVDPAAKIKLHCGGTQTNFVIDVTGYYQ